MKLLVVFASVVAFLSVCSSYSIPLVPGDNSHYVEGISRYIWMPDGDGVPHLVDLHAEPEIDVLRSRDGSDNEYWLFTRSNPTNPQIITYGDEESIRNSNYDSTKPLKVISHGWNNNGNSNVNQLITSAFLAVLDANVIVLDWNKLSGSLYVTASNGVPSVGRHLGEFLVWLIETAGGDWNNVHLVGHSLGAHVVANAGRAAGGRAVRVTGLDPAGPLWGGNDDALSTDVGQYVESIHTDAGILGISEPISHVDFYPNGGHNPQPGCWISTCSHSRSYELFASSVRTNHFIGRECSNTIEALANQCRGNTLHMGNSILTKRGSGLYGLTTGSEWPF